METKRIIWVSVVTLLVASFMGTAHGQTTIEISDDRDIIINGIDSSDFSGSPVAMGDINGDGTQDLIIGGQGGDPGGRTNAGETYVLFGPLSAGTLELSTSANITINGIDSADFSGSGVATGDINGDGAQDLIIGAFGGDPGGRTDAGETYVLFGPLSAGTLELSTSANITINGIDSSDQAGIGLATGDIDEDGWQDLVIGAIGGDPDGRTNAGEAYVLFGPLSAGTLELSTSAGMTINGIDSADGAGLGLAMGDINGDAAQDLLIGAQGGDPGGRTDAGEAYVLFGPLSPGILELSTSANITINGIDSGDGAGFGVAIGDIDGDILQDLAIGAFGGDPGGRVAAGETYGLFGPLSAGTLELSTSAEVTINGIDDADQSGSGLATGDINGDGFQDLVIGAWMSSPGGRTNAGKTYVLFGSPPTATLLVPWYNDAGTGNLASFITVVNPFSQTITVTVAYTSPAGQNATPAANTFVIGPNRTKAGRPFQVSGAGEGVEAGPPVSMPNATIAPFGSATFTAQVPAGSRLAGDTLRSGLINLGGEGPFSFSGIAPGAAR